MVYTIMRLQSYVPKTGFLKKQKTKNKPQVL